MRAILLQHVYPTHGFLPMVLDYVPRHAEYCAHFGIDYEFFTGEIMPWKKGHWDKIILVKEALLSNYDLVIWLDADAIIKDLSFDLKNVPLERDQIGVVYFTKPEPHYNVGVMYFRNGPRVQKFVEDWARGYPGDEHWHEQQVFNELVKTPAPDGAFVIALPAVFNASRDHNWTPGAYVAAGHGIGPLGDRRRFLEQCLSMP